MRTQISKISLLTFCTALSVLEASNLVPDNIVDRVARPKSTGALQREKAQSLTTYVQDRADLVLALDRSIGPDFEWALREVLGSSPAIDGLTQKQISEILHKVEERKRAKEKAGNLIVRASLEPMTANVRVQNTFFIQHFHMGSGNSQRGTLLPLSSYQANQVYPGGTPNFSLLANSPHTKENGEMPPVKKPRSSLGSKRPSWGELLPLPSATQALED